MTGPSEHGSDARSSKPIVAVYGTLRRGERNHHLIADAELLGRGTVAGRLFGMPRTDERAYGYPAFVPEAGGRVVVELYRLPDTERLAILDGLEAYDPSDEGSSEYLRRRIDVVGGPVAEAWIYHFAGEPPSSAVPIPDGDWVAQTVVPDR